MHRNFAPFALALLLAGCNPHVTIDQTKPIEINFNFSGRLDLVIHEQQDMEAITGEKPTNTVRPEDIGLAPATGGALAPINLPLLADDPRGDDTAMLPVLLKNPQRASQSQETATYFIAATDDLKKSLTARNPQIRTLWDSKLVGESHTGLLVVKGTVTPEQKKLIEDENADRTALFTEEAKTKTATADEISLAFYVARLGYAKNGAWFEKKNAAGTWEWKQWGQ